VRQRRTNMNMRTAGFSAVLTGLLMVAGCEIEQTEEGELPDVDVDASSGQLPEFEQTEEGELPDVDVDVAEEGNLPEFDVDAPDVDVGSREEQVEVPTDVDVETEERTITVPDVDINSPDEDDDEPRQ